MTQQTNASQEVLRLCLRYTSKDGLEVLRVLNIDPIMLNINVRRFKL